MRMDRASIAHQRRIRAVPGETRRLREARPGHPWPDVRPRADQWFASARNAAVVAQAMPSMARRFGFGKPGPAIHGRAFGTPRGSAVIREGNAAVHGAMLRLPKARPGHPWPGARHAARQCRHSGRKCCRPWRSASASESPARPSMAGRSARRAAVPSFGKEILPSMARRFGFGKPGPAIHGRAFGRARASGSQGRGLTH